MREKQLTNYEVFQHLHEVKEKRRHTASQGSAASNFLKAENLETIIIELQAYLRDRPAGNENAPQTADNIGAFMRELQANKLALEKAEKLQLINSAPSSMPVLYSLVEECELRFSPEQLELMLNLCRDYLGEEPSPVAAE